MSRLRWATPLRDDGRRGFADWVRALRGHDGVYLIRESAKRKVLYIGESHTGRLYETLTRHMFAWSGYGSGPTYDPRFIDVAVIVSETPLDDPVADQYALIQKYQPPDNTMDGRTLFWRVAESPLA